MPLFPIMSAVSLLVHVKKTCVFGLVAPVDSSIAGYYPIRPTGSPDAGRSYIPGGSDVVSNYRFGLPDIPHFHECDHHRRSGGYRNVGRRGYMVGMPI